MTKLLDVTDTPFQVGNIKHFKRTTTPIPTYHPQLKKINTQISKHCYDEDKSFERNYKNINKENEFQTSG